VPPLPDAAPASRPPTGFTEAELAHIRGGRGRYLAGAVALLSLAGVGYFVASRPKPVDDLQPAATPPPPKLAAIPTPPPDPAPALAPKPAPTPAAASPSPPPMPEKKLRKVSVVSEPVGAKVIGRKGPLGVTPLTFELPEGSGETIKVKAAGYRTAMREVGAADTEVRVTLSKVAAGSGNKPAAGESSTEEDPYGKVDDLKTPY
jgi:hypothetical protein